MSRSEEHAHRFVAEAAHALWTPLTLARLQLERALQSQVVDREAELGLALELLDDSILVVKRILQLERLTPRNSMKQLTLASVDLAAVTRQVLEPVALLAADQGIEIRSSLVSMIVQADAAALREALLNLLDNAIRHAGTGGWISVRTRSRGTWTELRIEDSGQGIEPDHLERVFDRFYSKRATGSGLGLGLPIARAIAEAHGGRLFATSPKGAQFVLRLPRSVVGAVRHADTRP